MAERESKDLGELLEAERARQEETHRIAAEQEGYQVEGPWRWNLKKEQALDRVPVNFTQFLAAERTRPGGSLELAYKIGSLKDHIGLELGHGRRLKPLGRRESYDQLVVEHRLNLASILQHEAHLVANEAQGKVEKDVRIGKLLPRAAGWYAGIKKRSETDGNARMWDVVEPTIILEEGKLITTHPINARRWNSSIRLSPKLDLTEFVGVDDVAFTEYRTHLAQFVLRNNISIETI